jgi:uncharacterized protein YkwD
VVDLASMERQAHERLNRHRAQRGLAPFRYSEELAAIARGHSQDMASGRTGFGHGGFDERARAIGRVVDYRSVA